jgi:hypothetical protein
MRYTIHASKPPLPNIIHISEVSFHTPVLFVSGASSFTNHIGMAYAGRVWILTDGHGWLTAPTNLSLIKVRRYPEDTKFFFKPLLNQPLRF